MLRWRHCVSKQYGTIPHYTQSTIGTFWQASHPVFITNHWCMLPSSLSTYRGMLYSETVLVNSMEQAFRIGSSGFIVIKFRTHTLGGHATLMKNKSRRSCHGIWPSVIHQLLKGEQKKHAWTELLCDLPLVCTPLCSAWQDHRATTSCTVTMATLK